MLYNPCISLLWYGMFFEKTLITISIFCFPKGTSTEKMSGFINILCPKGRKKVYEAFVITKQTQ